MAAVSALSQHVAASSPPLGNRGGLSQVSPHDTMISDFFQYWEVCNIMTTLSSHPNGPLDVLTTPPNISTAPQNSGQSLICPAGLTPIQ